MTTPTTKAPKKTASWVLANELGKPIEEILKLGEKVSAPEDRTRVHAKLTWYSKEAADRIRQAATSPLTVAKRFKGFALHVARNPRWMFCRLDGVPGKVPVAIPRKLIGKLERKYFEVEAIEDVKGITYRHAAFAPKT